MKLEPDNSLYITWSSYTQTFLPWILFVKSSSIYYDYRIWNFGTSFTCRCQNMWFLIRSLGNSTRRTFETCVHDRNFEYMHITSLWEFDFLNLYNNVFNQIRIHFHLSFTYGYGILICETNSIDNYLIEANNRISDCNCENLELNFHLICFKKHSILNIIFINDKSKFNFEASKLLTDDSNSSCTFFA